MGEPRDGDQSSTTPYGHLTPDDAVPVRIWHDMSLTDKNLRSGLGFAGSADAIGPRVSDSRPRVRPQKTGRWSVSPDRRKPSPNCGPRQEPTLRCLTTRLRQKRSASRREPVDVLHLSCHGAASSEVHDPMDSSRPELAGGILTDREALPGSGGRTGNPRLYRHSIGGAFWISHSKKYARSTRRLGLQRANRRLPVGR